MRGVAALASAAAARWGPGGSAGHGLTSDCIFSSAWQREGRERQTEAGSQEGSEARPRLSAGRRTCTEPPHTHSSAPQIPPGPPPSAHSHAGGGAARRWLLRRSRWRRRWRPGTAPIRELQQNKSCQEAESSWGHGGLCGDPGRVAAGLCPILTWPQPHPGRAAWGAPWALSKPQPLCLGPLSPVPRTPGTAGHPPRLKPAHQHLCGSGAAQRADASTKEVAKHCAGCASPSSSTQKKGTRIRGAPPPPGEAFSAWVHSHRRPQGRGKSPSGSCPWVCLPRRGCCPSGRCCTAQRWSRGWGCCWSG